MSNISFIPIAKLFIIIWLCYRILTNIKIKKLNKLRECVITLFFIYFLAVVYYTFFKSGILMISEYHRFYANLIPLKETFKMFADNNMGLKNSLYNVVGNILLFVPLGFFIPLLFHKCNKISKVLFYGFIASLTIETIQLFTAFNLTDIDDVIFNTLGAVIGLLFYRVFYSLIKALKLSFIVEKIKDFDKSRLIPLALKPLVVMLFCTGLFIIYDIYSKSYPSSIFDNKTSVQAFASNSKEKISKDFNQYKLLLNDYSDYLELSGYKRLPGNRYINITNHQMSLKSDKTGYSIETIYNNSDNSVGIVMFGKNTNAETIIINFNGKEYTGNLDIDSNFIVPFPSYEKLPTNTDLYNIFSNKTSKDLQIKFLDKYGEECKDMKSIK